MLKDAAAASIWGARASNGVIVIKTKGGTSNGQKLEVKAGTQLSFSGKRDVDQITNQANSANTINYLRVYLSRRLRRSLRQNLDTVHAQPVSQIWSLCHGLNYIYTKDNTVSCHLMK